jgi:pilus assembly protein Flp/PilA
MGAWKFCGSEGIIETIDMENAMLRLIRDLKADKRGVTMIEYALIAGLVSVVAIAMLTAMGTSVNNLYSTINSALTTA